VTNEYRKLFGDPDGACVVSSVGLDADFDQQQLRGELRTR
jgi:hypothetical protein